MPKNVKKQLSAANNKTKPENQFPNLEPVAHTTHETAYMLRLSERFVRKLVSNKQLVARKVGRRTLIPRSSIDAFMRKDHPTTLDEKVEK